MTLPKPTLMPPGLMREVLRPPPHSLEEAVAELIFLKDGQLIFCERDQGVHTAKFVSAADVKGAFDPVLTDSGWLPQDVVRWGSGDGKQWVVLFKPSQRYNLILKEPQGRQTTINVPLPSLVILVLDHNMWVWAVKTPVFRPDTLPFQVPLPNNTNEGLVCFGANKHEPASLETANGIWETWISGAFTGESCTNRSKGYPDDVRERLRLLQTQKKYPHSDLIPYQRYDEQTIEMVITRRIGAV